MLKIPPAGRFTPRLVLRFAPRCGMLLVVLAAGCDLIGRPPLTEGFGAAYAVVAGAPSAEPGVRTTPFLTTDGRLYVVVDYVGGCATHRFRSDYAVSDTEARVWLVHDDPGDPCEALVREEVSVQLNPAVFTRGEIILATPDGAYRLTPALLD